MKMLLKIQRYIVRNKGAFWAKTRDELIAIFWMRPAFRTLFGWMFHKIEPRQWVFVSGCYNSGTTILREILGAHPEIAALPREGVRLTSAFPQMEIGGWQRMWHKNSSLDDTLKNDPKDTRDQAARDWAPFWRKDKTVFLEKSITHSCRMPFLEKAFPNARFIFVQRNGYCATEGILRRAKPQGQAAMELGQDIYPASLAAKQWVVSNMNYQDDAENLNDVYLVRYEDFVENPMMVLRDILTFMDLSCAPLNNLGDGNIQMGARRFKISNQNLKSIARLSDDDKREITPVIAPLMQKLGYDLEVGFQ